MANLFYFGANAQFDNSEQTEISPMATPAVNITAAFHIVIKSSNILSKQLQFLLMIIANTNSETPTIDC